MINLRYNKKNKNKRKEKLIYIYGLRDPKSKDIRYIGRTSNLRRRYREHLKSNRSSSCHKVNWIKSLEREGLKPEMTVLTTAYTLEEAIAEETKHQNLYKNLTNHKGKDGSYGFIPGSERLEIRKEIIARCVETGKETLYKGIYSLPDEFNPESVSRCLRKDSVEHKGYYWRYASEDFVKPELEKSKGYGFIRISEDGEKSYYSKTTDAMKEGFDSAAIQRCARGVYKQHKGYTWKFATKEDKEFFTGNSKKEAFQRNKPKPVVGVHKYTNEVIKLDHVNADSRFDYNGIYRCCNGKQEYYKNFKWSYL